MGYKVGLSSWSQDTVVSISVHARPNHRQIDQYLNLIELQYFVMHTSISVGIKTMP